MQKTREKTRTRQKPDVQKFKANPDSELERIFNNQEKEYARILGKGRRPGRLRPCEPALIRKLDDLKYIGGPFNIPKWITPQYIADCMENRELQKKWVPKKGDWYLDADLSSLWRVESRKEYDRPYAPPPGVNLEKARTKNGRWLWHYYLPKPQIYLCMSTRELTMDEMRHISISLKCHIKFVGKVAGEEIWNYNIDGTVLTAKDKEVVRTYDLTITNDL
jgi:hypothetical protein